LVAKLRDGADKRAPESGGGAFSDIGSNGEVEAAEAEATAMN
jgi:hypothetical protein